jgi:hypothetical protein
MNEAGRALPHIRPQRAQQHAHLHTSAYISIRQRQAGLCHTYGRSANSSTHTSSRGSGGGGTTAAAAAAAAAPPPPGGAVAGA